VGLLVGLSCLGKIYGEGLKRYFGRGVMEGTDACPPGRGRATGSTREKYRWIY